ncbi:MAG: HAD-IA family hydrolase [Sulfolobaceae archaeon]
MTVISVDLGDTLVSFTPRRYELIYEILKDHGYAFSLRKVYRAYVKVMAKHNFPDENGVNPFDVRDFLYELGIKPTDEKLIMEISRIKRGDEYFLLEDAEDFLEWAKSKGYKIVLVSNATPRAKKVVEELGLNKYFTQTIFSFEVGLVKPNPKIFSIVTRRVGIPIYHVGDIMEMDYAGAERSGLRGVLLNRFGFYDFGVKSLKDLTKD